MTRNNERLHEVVDELKEVDPVTGFPASILLGFSDVSAQSEHLARYIFAAKYARGLLLDIATGTGYGASILAQTDSNYVIAADINTLGLIYGKRVYDQININWVRCDATHLPFRDSSFDSIVSMETLEHVEEPIILIREFHRIINHQGLLILSTPNRSVTSPILSGPLNPHHSKEYGLKEIQKILRSENIEFKRCFVQTRISLKWVIARYFGMPLTFFFVKAGMSILLLRRFLNIFRNQQEILDPNPSLYPVSAYSRILDCLTHFQLIIFGRKQARKE